MPFAGRLTIRGTITVLSGLHIGAGITGGIGLIDTPLVRDPLTRRPIVPGSSLKGRLRHALELLVGAHHPEVSRLFGAPTDHSSKERTRLFVRDAVLTAQSASKLESMDTDSLYVEIKSENRINRASGVAEHPRQIERLPAGAILNLEMVYNPDSTDQVSDDLQNLAAALDFIEDEYLGANGSRGYGKVAFQISSLEWKSLDHYKTRQRANAKDATTSWVQEAVELVKSPATAGA
ncbi:MAG: type III-A CRISPR-associated RAMP protein Csm3 [Candidatus Obscuribacterales bacterium]|nr:type III-A CRISPR-associated RAMP protein Csm3 [Candidatus Obscuribacterales bacterium]